MVIRAFNLPGFPPENKQQVWQPQKHKLHPSNDFFTVPWAPAWGFTRLGKSAKKFHGTRNNAGVRQKLTTEYRINFTKQVSKAVFGKNAVTDGISPSIAVGVGGNPTSVSQVKTVLLVSQIILSQLYIWRHCESKSLCEFAMIGLHNHKLNKHKSYFQYTVPIFPQ